jgi:hypothetical protein
METFLDRPTYGPTLESGASIEMDGSGETGRRDAWVRIRTLGINGAGRLRMTGSKSSETFHIAALPAGSLRIDLGDLIPDLGIGLISSGRRFTYPFSSRHPLYRPRGIRGWTGFYGSFIRGGSIDAEAGPVRLTILTGRLASHTSSGVKYSAVGKISGFRMEAGRGEILGGLTAMDSGSRRGDLIMGLDLTLSSNGRTCMLETAASSSGKASAVWGIRIDRRDLDCGIIWWSVPAGSDGFLASFPGLSSAAERSRSGASITMTNRFPWRIYLSSWGEMRRSSDGSDRVVSRALRLEAGIRWKRSSARFRWSSNTKESETMVPFPPGYDPRREVSRGLALSYSCRPASFLDLVIEMKRHGNDSGEGLLGSARASIALKNLHSRLSFCAASYRSGRGKARFSLYEPSGGARYPWKTLYGSGNRFSIDIDTRGCGLRASFWLLWTTEDEKRAAVHLVWSI